MHTAASFRQIFASLPMSPNYTRLPTVDRDEDESTVIGELELFDETLRPSKSFIQSKRSLMALVTGIIAAVSIGITVGLAIRGRLSGTTIGHVAARPCEKIMVRRFESQTGLGSEYGVYVCSFSPSCYGRLWIFLGTHQGHPQQLPRTLIHLT